MADADGGGRAARFAALASAQALPPALAADAQALLEALSPSVAAYDASEEGHQPLAERTLFALVLFSAKTHYAGPEPTPSLSDLSSMTDVSLMEVFRVLPPFLAYASKPLQERYGEGVEARLRVNPLRRGLAFSFVLAEKYRRLFRAVLTTPSGNTARTPVRPGPGGAAAAAGAAAEDLSQDSLSRFGWYLFCFAKLHLVDADADLNHLVDILVAVLVVLVAHAPAERRLFPLHDVAVYPHRREDGSPDVVLALTTLAKSSASSCAEYLEQVLKLVPQLGEAAVPAGPAAEAVAGSTCFPGLLAPSRVAAAADAASKAYIDAARVAGEEIDQRLFLRESGSGGGSGATAPLDPSQLTPRRQTHGSAGGAPSQHGRATPAPMRNISSMLATPMRPAAAAAAPASTPSAQLASMRSPAAGAVAPRSPISRMFVSASWLRQITASFVPADVEPQLMRYLSAAVSDPAALHSTLLEQAQRYAHLVFPSPPQLQASVPLHLAAAGRGSHVTPTRFAAGTSAVERQSLMEELAANAALLASNQNAAAESRRAMVLALYFRMLARILMAEEQKLTGAASAPSGGAVQAPDAPPAPGSPAPPAASAPNFGPMLRNERVLRALFSVCADCVAEAMHVTSWQFPAFQHLLQVLPFEAVGLVHLVAECDRELPYELKRSLASMMDQLLERLVWERGSGFYTHLMHEKGVGAPPPSSDGAAPPSAGGTQSSGGGAAATGVSGTAGGGAGAERVLLPLRYGPVAESMPPGRARTHCCKALTMVHRMLSRRLTGITERLAAPMPDALCEAVRSLLLTALFEHTCLFYGRHADTILICSIYGCAKAAAWPRADSPLMFREIVSAYRAMKISDTGVPPDEALWRAIPLTFGGPPGDPALEVTRHDDLVRFYNEIYLKEIKPAMLVAVRTAGLLAEVRRGADGAPPPASPAAHGAGRAQARAAEPAAAQRAPFAVLPAASPRRVSVAPGGGGVMVSPMRPDRAAELRSSVAAPRALYAFVGDSISALTSPSHDLDRFNDALRTAAQRAAEGGGAAEAGEAGGDAPPSAGRDRRRALTRQELPPPTRRRISEQM